MTKRYLWTIVSAVVCMGASPTAVLAAKAPEDFVCNTQTGKGLCADIKTLGSMPKKEQAVRHIAKDQLFRLYTDGAGNYSFKVNSSEWLPPFLTATLLTWKSQLKGTMPAEICQAYVDATQLKPLSAAMKAKLKATAFSEYSHFATDTLPIHLKDKAAGLQLHTFQIFPIEDYVGGKPGFCLMFESEQAHGASHDGAVHGEP
jgi:hypothetical protein